MGSFFMSNISKHSLYGLLIRLTLSEITNGELEIEIEEPSIMVGDDKELDELITKKIELMYACNSELRALHQQHAEKNSAIIQSLQESLLETSSEERVKKVPCTRHRFQRDVVEVLNSWLFDNESHPFPTPEEKESLPRKTGLSLSQINQWFTNARRRTLKS